MELNSKMSDIQCKFEQLSSNVKTVNNERKIVDPVPNTKNARPLNIIEAGSTEASGVAPTMASTSTVDPTMASKSTVDPTMASTSTAVPTMTSTSTVAESALDRSWANIAQQPSPSSRRKVAQTDADGFTMVQRRISIPRRISGKKQLAPDAKIKTLPRRITVFVSRLHLDTSVENLVEFLEAGGINSPMCKKLSAKEGSSFKTAAFMVSCEVKDRELIYDEATWPAGCELRDWVFYDKKRNVNFFFFKWLL